MAEHSAAEQADPYGFDLVSEPMRAQDEHLAPLEEASEEPLDWAGAVDSERGRTK